MSKKKYCETLKPGFYYINGEESRCFYVTGTTKGNKWIDLYVPNPQWMTLMWNCIDSYEINLSTFHQQNPTDFSL
jgi:hypothetical protein